MLCKCGCGQHTNVARFTDRSKGWVKGEPIKFIKGHSGGVVNLPSNDPKEIGWAAGFYEGEGTFVFTCGYISMSIHQVDKWPLVRFLATVGAGSISGPYSHSANQPQWYWTCGGWERCKQVVELMWDDLSPRRQQQIELAVSRFLERR